MSSLYLENVFFPQAYVVDFPWKKSQTEAY